MVVVVAVGAVGSAEPVSCSICPSVICTLCLHTSCLTSCSVPVPPVSEVWLFPRFIPPGPGKLAQPLGLCLFCSNSFSPDLPLVVFFFSFFFLSVCDSSCALESLLPDIPSPSQCLQELALLVEGSASLWPVWSSPSLGGESHKNRCLHWVSLWGPRKSHP